MLTPEAQAAADFLGGRLKPDGPFREIIESLPVAVYATDADGRLTYFNRAAATLSGRVPVLGTDQWCVTWKLFLPDGTPLPHDQCPIALALKGAEVSNGIECIAERPDGSRFWFTPYPAVLRGEDGQIVGGINVLVDVTARKIAEVEAINISARKQAERAILLLGAIVDFSDDAIISKDLNGTITSWNSGAERLFGYSAAEVVGRPVTILIPPDRLEEEPQILARLRKGERVDHFETLRRRKDGSLIDISLTISPVKDLNGNVIGASKIARDITDRKQAEAAQKRVEEDLRRANEDLEQFAFSASHDLQEPLRSIKIYSELLQNSGIDELSGEAREFLAYMRSGATRMEMLVRDLLSYTQVTKFEQPVEPADAGEALQSALASLASIISETGARVTSDPLPSLCAHRVHLQQLFQNLIGNSIKYRSPDRPPVVDITVERQDAQWAFAVADNGIGIEPEYRDKIFGLFKRLHTNDEFSGTGIGLAICRRIVDRYNGRIWVESQIGKGSTFHFTLPI